jgi:hypothetical protein
MRFTKSEILDEFTRQDRSYRLAIIASHWLQGGGQYKPSAVEEARGLQMKVLDTWISYADLADLLEQDASRFSITTDFVLNQLHALIRVPFELLSDYCEDYNQAGPGRKLTNELVLLIGTSTRAPSATRSRTTSASIFQGTKRTSFPSHGVASY